MIEIKSLNKIYRSKKRSTCHALNDINLTLPDNGLVFVLGKSGSGKSTLLNLIGGLDSITGGKIIVDGNDISEFSERSFCDYRNTHIGFIFQDYHLIDELTIYDNIVLSLNLRREEDGDKVKEALKRVDFEGYETRYPSELSGGERQRIAIARAIVKSPRIILADEPTGNLDTNTGTAIIELLKRLSRECLILIVSHNINDANNYADRIIELAKGKIIADNSRNPEFADNITLAGDKLVYPDTRPLSDEDIKLINDNPDKQLVKRTDKFIKTEKSNDKAKKIEIEHKTLSLGKKMHLSGSFLKNKTFAIMLSAFIVAVVMVIMSLAQTIINFDASRVIGEEMARTGQSSLLLEKVDGNSAAFQLETSYRVQIGDNDIQSFYDAGYKGKIYPVYNISVPINEYRNYAGVSSSYFKSSRFISETLGTIVVDEEFLTDRFGEIKYLAKAEKQDPAGVIITDYVADSILALNSFYKEKKYEDILGSLACSGWTTKVIYINGIIETDYKDKYADFLGRITSGELKKYTDICLDPDFVDYMNDVYERLGFSFSLNPDFENAYKESWGPLIINRQKIMVNKVHEVPSGSANRIYFIRDHAVSGNTVSGLYYTEKAPYVPKGAKYMRVSSVSTSSLLKAEKYQTLLIKDRDYALVKFSDGTEVTEEQLKFQNCVFLKTTGITENRPSNKTYWVSDYIEIPEGADIEEFCTLSQYSYAYCSFYDENRNFIDSYDSKDRQRMEPMTIYMNYEQYNELFGAEYKKEEINNFIPHKVNLTQYKFYDHDFESPLLSIDVTIVGLTTTAWEVSEDIADMLLENQVYYTGLYFDGREDIGQTLNAAEELHYDPQSYSIEGVHTMTKAVDVFIPIFSMIAIILCVGVVFILTNFSVRMIKDKMHEIGILKALGTKNSDIAIIFGLQVLLIAILTCILTTAGYFVFIDMANDVLIGSLKQLAPSHVVLDLDFLIFQPVIALLNCVIVFILSGISLALPMFKIKAIKPVKIIKTKD